MTGTRVLDGSRVLSEDDFHREAAALLDFGPYYGRNLHALWDRLSTDIERPILLIWKESEISRAHMPDTFQMIVDVLERTRQQDISLGWADKFDYRLE